MKTNNVGSRSCRRTWLFAAFASVFCEGAQGAQYQWDFTGNLHATFGNGILSYADFSTESLTMFGSTDGATVPHIGDQAASYMRVPAFTELSEGYNAEFADTGPNGGGEYVNQYTMIFDILEPGPLNWTPFFNTNPENPGGNDADLYLAYDGAIGIGADYTALNVVVPDTWYRVAFTTDLGANQFTIYVDGVQKYQHSGGNLIDDRWALFSNADAGHDIRLFNEGDTTGNYTHEFYISSFFFADRTLTPTEIQTLGGPDANGIVNLTGDYNLDGAVDGADYVVWRNAGGPPQLYTAWRNNFGQNIATGSAGGIASPGTVPEPASVAIVGLALAGGLAVVRRK